MQKKIINFLLIVGCIGVVKANDDSGQLAVALAKTATNVYGASSQHNQSLPTQRNLLRTVYWLDKHNPHFYKLHQFQENFDYYIVALTDHIKELEGKIALGKSGLTSWGMVKGIGLSGLSALSGYTAYFLHQARYMNKGASFHARQNLMEAVVSMSFVSAIFAVVAIQQFHKVARYAERLVERLERDKRLLVNFQNEKPNLSKNHIVSAALKLIEVVAEAVDTNASMVQPQNISTDADGSIAA